MEIGSESRHMLCTRQAKPAKGASDSMLKIRLVAAVAVLGFCIVAPPGEGASRTLAVTCSNPSSGATWQIAVDLEHSTVDANPASVSDAAISWHDSKDGWNYKLDRHSGELTVVVASSTGGYFLHDRCELPP